MHGLLSTCLQNSHAIANTQLSFSDMESRKKEIDDSFVHAPVLLRAL
jgi:hypothetical protein